MAMHYPLARRDETVEDDYHGTKIKDPYRWMENLESQELNDYICEMNKISSSYLNSYPMRKAIFDRLTSIQDYEKFGSYRKEGNSYFYLRNEGLQNQSVFYITDDWKTDGRPLLDPNLWSPDGTVALSMLSFSCDGSCLAYGIQEKGSDVTTVKFKSLPSGVDLPDVLNSLLYSSIAWVEHGKSVLYTMFPSHREGYVGEQKMRNHSLYCHKLGTKQCEDVLCFSFPEEPEALLEVETSEDEQFVVCTVTKGLETSNLVFICQLSSWDGNPGELKFTALFGEADAKYEFTGCHDGKLLFRTDWEAPNYEIVLVDIQHPDKANWTRLVKQDPERIIRWARIAHRDYLLVCCLKDVVDVVYVYDVNTMHVIKSLDLPPCAIADCFAKEFSNEVFIRYTSFVNSGVVARLDLCKSGSDMDCQVVRSSKLQNLPEEEFLVRQMDCLSNDGTKIPFTMITNKFYNGGPVPTILYGYGGFGISILPSFSVFRLAFVKGFKGIFVVANIRGGSEFGKKWHDSGRKEKKQNVFDDFVSIASYLCQQNYTAPKLLTIIGGSNGGLLVTVCANQHPELFGCVISLVGVLDMLRFNKFTIGQAWATEYGCPEKKADFETLIKYSPLHNLKPPTAGSQIPATLLLTADRDDRVVPSHSLKYIATLHHCVKDIDHQDNPLLIRVDTNAGHGGGRPTSKSIQEHTDMLTFIGKVMDLEWLF